MVPRVANSDTTIIFFLPGGLTCRLFHTCCLFGIEEYENKRVSIHDMEGLTAVPIKLKEKPTLQRKS